MPAGRKPPWYRQTEVIDRACAYVAAHFALFDKQDDPPQFAQATSYKFDALIDLIFESNTFESAGLPAAETRAVLEELGVDAIAKPRPTKRVIEVDQIRDVFELIGALDRTELATVRYRKRSRASREVIQHFLAWMELVDAATMHAFQLRGGNEEDLARELAEEAAAEAHLTVSEVLEWPFWKRGQRAFFLSEEQLKKVHAILAEELLPDDAKVPPGTYRIDHRVAGRATGFVAPSLIPAAMRKLENDARIAFQEPLTAREPKALELAAAFSHRIVAIHPFPDFNGRLSRLLLAACLEWAGIPFPVAIKSDKKGRERYLYALKKGDKGDFRPMTALVARAVVEGFEAIDAKLELAGLPRLLPPA